MQRAGIAGITIGMCLAGYLIPAAEAQSGPRPVTAITTVLPDGRTQLAINNSSGVWLTAYAVEATESGRKRHTTWLRDSTLAAGVAPIAPGGAASLIVGQPDEHPLVTFHAGLFQDGSTFGESEWVQRLQNRRVYAAEAMAAALTDVRTVGATATTPADLAQRVRDLEQARIHALPAATTAAQGIDRNDRVSMFTTRYPVVLSRITGGACRFVASMTDCANAVVAGVEHNSSVATGLPRKH